MIALCGALLVLGLSMFALHRSCKRGVQQAFLALNHTRVEENAAQQSDEKKPNGTSHNFIKLLDDERRAAFFEQVDHIFNKLLEEVREKNRQGFRALSVDDIDDFTTWSAMYALRLKRRYDVEPSQQEYDAIHFYNRKMEHIAQRFRENGIEAHFSETAGLNKWANAQVKMLTLTW